MTFTGPARLFAKPRVSARQAGGTFLGFLLGMLFGLAVALGVAVYITKMPLPFMNKNQTRPADDAAAAKKIKEWDPNAGLPGRVAKPEGAAVQAAPESDPAAPAAATAPTGPAATTAPPAAAPAAPAPAKSADPLGDLARARAEAQASAVPATLVLFFVQDRLQAAPGQEGIFLALYFCAAAVSMPLWLRAVQHLGLVRCWLRNQ